MKVVKKLKTKITYEINYKKKDKIWVLWKTTECSHCTDLRGIFKGTKKECEEKKKELMKNESRRTKRKI